MKTTYERNISIDTGRIIFAFLVVSLHTRFPISLITPYIADIGKVAVPFFYTVSGYYLYSNSSELIIGKTIMSSKKIAKVVLAAAILYGILKYIEISHFHVDISDQSFRLIPFLLFNDVNFTGHFWYCFAYLYVLLIIIALAKFDRVDYLLYLTPVLLAIHFTFTIWSRHVPIASGKFWYELNWFVVALPYMTIGMVLRKNIHIVSEINKKGLLAIATILLLLIFPEHYAFKQIVGHGPGVFSIALLAISIAIYCVLNGIFFTKTADAKLAELGRKHALNIYVYHVLVRECLTITGVGLWANNTISIFFISLILSTTLIGVKGKILNRFNNGELMPF
jgi:peptidoglycan/LPS O-acetylase OafA/YrhL